VSRVSLEGVRKVYGNGHVAVEEATCVAQNGELLVLVGPSGCGKSTLLRLVAGLETVTSGTVSIGDRVVNDVAPKDRDIAMVFQSYALYPHLSVRDNLSFGLRMRKALPAEIDRRVRAAAEKLGLTSVLGRKPKELSGGQRQRVALGRALVREPRVFLLDEPLSNLDPQLRTQVRRDIADLHRELGSTMLYVTHDQVEAMTLGDRIVVLDRGRIQQIGTPLELYDRPANLFVAGFLGSPAMNLIPGTVDGTHFVPDGADGWSIPLPNPPSAGRTVLGVRPEGLHLDPNGTTFTVRAVELLGSDAYVHATRGSLELNARLAPKPLPRPGDPIPLALDPTSLHFFDPQTQQSLA
jgi:multiple sugar transport system ATP-binding protein